MAVNRAHQSGDGLLLVSVTIELLQLSAVLLLARACCASNSYAAFLLTSPAWHVSPQVTFW
jgi:hypothetical protein